MEGRRNMSSLQRLVARVPHLNENPAIMALLAKGSHLTGEDVLNMCQELFLMPELTVVIAGCFRHLLPRIMQGLVDSLRESHAHRPLAETSTDLRESFISTRSWNLLVHEYAVIAFSRTLELASPVSSSILDYFSFAPPPFERLLLHRLPVVDQKTRKLQPSLLDVARASYRFILLEPASFESFWDWSPFLDLLLFEGFEEKDVRWCAVQILARAMKLSDEATRALSLKISCLTETEAFSCLLRWEEFCHEISVEKAGWFVEPSAKSKMSNFEPTLLDEQEQHIKWKFDLSGSATYVDVCGIQLPVRKNMIRSGLVSSFSKSMLANPKLKGNLKTVALALRQRDPILLLGSAGSGKTTLIRELCELTGNTDAVFIHLSEQVDAKSLLGTYVCTEIPGDFQWQPGPITQAVLQGLWLVLEDVDKAHAELLSALNPLLESRQIYIPGRAETVKAASNFQLFSTVTSTDTMSASHSAGANVMNNLWRRVVLLPPNNNELGSIIEMLFPSLKPRVPMLIETLKLIDAFASNALLPFDGTSTRVHFGRRPSIKDLLKWCKRLKNVNEIGHGVQSSSVCERIFSEAVDCFAACISDVKSRRSVVNGIAKLWGIGEEHANYSQVLNKPILQIIAGAVQVGRASLSVEHHKPNRRSHRPFAYTGHSMRDLERIAMCVQQQEPVLLVGETGTGKTSLVQHLAEKVAVPLIVMNLSQQSDSADLIGGFKPVEAQQVCMKLLESFKELFNRTFPSQDNSGYLARIHQFAEKKKFKQLLKAFGTATMKVESLRGSPRVDNAVLIPTLQQDQPVTKRKRPLTSELMNDWERFTLELHKSERQVLAAEKSFAFTFVEGAFVRAWKHGHWILLDELNLAPVEVLERLTGVLDGEDGTLNLTERGDIMSLPRHPRFRVFACMNPATDVGKHDLPSSLRARFTEIYVDEAMGVEDLQLFVLQYLEGLIPSPPVAPIVHFYQQAIQAAEFQLYDSANQKPRYSLRSLARALEYTQVAMPLYGFARALYDGVCMTFLTLLDGPSSVSMENLIQSQLMKNIGLASKNLLARTPAKPGPNHMEFEHFWLEKGSCNPSVSALEFTKKYVLTRTVKEHLKHVAKAVFIRKYPVLLQGPTSSGKTSSIEYLATITGHRFVRINNHEHTDLQEYLGTYVTNEHGKLVFQEGILVDAVRNGYWIVLDELNLAPSEVLEALNRLLDDNQELYIPELQSIVKPHPHFMLFATQNPPGLYGGRKVLSRAFRNRFVELHVDDIPEDELCIILEQRCEVPKSYAEKMVAVMKDLQRNRQTSQAFAGKHGFITARDLFKWAERHRKSGMSYEDLARIGYILLAERLRDTNEKLTVRVCLEKNLHAKINMDMLYSELSGQSYMQEVKEHLAADKQDAVSFGSIVWTKSMTRLYSLVEQCYRNKEPVLLIGETGCGKTTVCQLLSVAHECCLRILNCHQHTETADFLGGFRPVRDRESIVAQFEQVLVMINNSELFCSYHSEKLPHSIEFAEDTISTLHKVILIAKASRQFVEEGINITNLEQCLQKLKSLKSDYQAIFVWQDGPLVEAMRRGEFFLIDEISLADDSVLERLNSVLEPKRNLVLAEKGGTNVEELAAHSNFFLMATMNPGGDFGKKELSPALRNRFTEIWVPPILEEDDLRSIIHTRFLDGVRDSLTDVLLSFWKMYQEEQSGRGLTVRDLLSWIFFVNSVEGKIGKFSAFIHGAFLVLLDGISLGTGVSLESARSLRNECLEFLLQQLPVDKHLLEENFNENTLMVGKEFTFFEDKVGICPFLIARGPIEPRQVFFELMAPTTSINTFRILRAMQLLKPVLIEGSPGVGKTSLITALANLTGHSLVRINLSEQTDMMDLLGSDLPTEGSEGGDFRWSDGVFLQALKVGSWVLLDELNLASQSVLEGLNSCLDHRGDIYIPELGRSFKCHPTFRIFACQNPHVQGGGRKCLPRSFLNRFTKVYVDTLSEEDFLFISKSLHPAISADYLQKLINFNSRILKETMVAHSFGNLGGPWEFNLRDILRSCALVEGSEGTNINFLEVVYLQRLRTLRDRSCILKIYEEVFGSPARLEACPTISIDPKYLRIGGAMLPRSAEPQFWIHKENLMFLPSQLKCMESLLFCIIHSWMSIIVGPAGSGKTSIVRLLARLMGKPLQEFVLSSGTDITDLLGCFEQYDAVRCWKQIGKKLGVLVKVLFGQCLITFDKTLSSHELLSHLQKLLAVWSNFESFLRLHTESSPSYSKCNSEKNMLHLMEIDLLLQVVDRVKFVSNMFSEPLTSVHVEVEGIEKDLVALKRRMNKSNISCFEWIDGGFLTAVQRGDWVLLENANMCNPAVLDRLNPLVEPNGSILVNERGLVSNNATVLQAHPNFRLFLTVDPRQGEVSRAMRNRGVEIHLLQPHTFVEDANHVNGVEEITKNRLDPRQFLIHAGIPSSSLVAAMCDAHIHASTIVDPSGLDYSVHLRELRQWVSLFWQLLNSGSSVSESLLISWEQVYLHGYEDTRAREVIMNSYNTFFPPSIFNAMVQSYSTLQLCGGWPRPLNASHFCRMSREAVTMRDCMYVKHLLGELAAYQLRTEWCSAETSERYSFSKWMETQKVAVLLPSPLFQLYLHPSSSMPTFSLEGCVQDANIFDSKVMFSSFWIMRYSCSIMARDMCYTWITWQAAKVWPHCRSLQRFCKVLQMESRHPMYEQTVKTFGHCGSINDDCLRLLDSLRRTLLQWQIEDNMLENVNQKTFRKTDSLMMYSFNFYTGKLKEDLKQSEWSDPGLAIYPLLLGVRNMEEKVLLCRRCAWDKETCKTYLELLDSHKQLHRAACDVLVKNDSYSEWHGLYTCWKKLRESVSDIRSAFALEMETSEFMETVWRIEEAFCAKRQSSKLYLWKHSGHPHIPTSKTAFQQLQALLKFCHSLWPIDAHEKNVSTRALWNEVFRRLVLEGVGMALFALQRRWKTKEDRSVQETGETVASDILKKLHDRLNAENMQKSLPAEFSTVPGCKCFPSHLLQNSCNREALALLKGSSQSTDLFVLPWLNALSLMEDRVAVAVVTQIASGLTSVFGHNVSLEKLADAKDCLLRVIDFSLKFSSRSPLDLVPHQQILWLVNAISAEEHFNDTFIKDFQSFAHQMRFNWYAAVFQRDPRDDMDPLSTGWGASMASYLFFDACNSVQLSHIIMEVVPLKQLQCKVLEMRLAMNVLWGLKSEEFQLHIKTEFLHASSALCQFILSFTKSLKEDDATKVFWLLDSLHTQALQGKNDEAKGRIQQLLWLLKKSTDKRFVASVDSHFSFCLDLLYCQFAEERCPRGFLYLFGKTWQNLGAARFRLVLPDHAFDPTAKYSYQHVVLLERHSETKLELQTRKEIDSIVCGSISEERHDLQIKIQELERKIEATAAKCVYRQSAESLKLLYNEISHFLKSMERAEGLFAWFQGLESDFEKQPGHDVTKEVFQWQDVSKEFIQGVLLKYSDYRDLAQPVLLAVLEVKLGLTLLLAASQQKNSMQQRRLCEWICGLIEFPTRHTFIGTPHSKTVIVNRVPALSFLEEGVIESFFATIGLEEQEKEIINMKVKLFKCSIVYLKNTLRQGGVVSGQSRDIISILLASISAFWRVTRDNLESRRLEQLSLLKVKHQSHDLGLDVDQDEEGFRSMFHEKFGLATDNPEKVETHIFEESLPIDTGKSHVSEKDWKILECELGKELTELLNVIFSLQAAPKTCWAAGEVSDEQRLSMFISTYGIGKTFLQGLGTMLPASLNERLISSHMLMLLLKQESLSRTEEKLKSFNIYEDPSSSELSLLLRSLEDLEQRILKLLAEWPNHPQLTQLMRGVDALLSMRVDVPLVKALTGVEQLLSKAQLWEVNAPKTLSLQDALSSLEYLVFKWRNLELEYWEVLLQKVESQFDYQAGKLWFPLHGVLHSMTRVDSESELEPLISSLEEFMQTAALGEYKSCIQMLSGFYGEFCIQKSFADLSSNVSCLSNMIRKVLFNLCGYYTQFLPLVENAITNTRNELGKELKDFLKLQKWEQKNYSALTCENIHRKLFKFIARYKVLLEKPALLSVIDKSRLWTIGHSKAGSENNQQPTDDVTKALIVHSDLTECENYTILSYQRWMFTLQSKVRNVSLAYSDSQTKTAGVHQNLCSVFPGFWEVLKNWAFSEGVTQARQRGTAVVEDLVITVISRSNELREGGKSRMVKKKALVDLLRALQSLGFSHHRTAIPKEKRSPRSWILQETCKVDCALNFLLRISSNGDINESGIAREHADTIASLWNKGCVYYYKNRALVEHLRQLSLKFHKDLTLKEVSAAISYLEHGLFIQQMQRSYAHKFAFMLINLQNVAYELGGIGSSENVDWKLPLQEPDLERKWLWLQKSLLDSLHNTSLETLLFYKKAEAMQSCPFDNSVPVLGTVIHRLETIEASLRACKANVDEVLVPGMGLFSVDDLEVSWPVLITSKCKKIMCDNSSTVSSAKDSLDALFRGADHNNSALQLFWEQCCQASKMFEDYKKQCKEGCSTMNILREVYETQKKQLIIEISLSMKELTRRSSQVDPSFIPFEHPINLGGKANIAIESQKVQSWMSFMEEQMNALRLDKVFEVVVPMINAGVRGGEGKDTVLEVMLHKEISPLISILELLIAAGIAIFADYCLLHKSLAKLSYVLGNVFETLFQEGFCKTQGEAEQEFSSNLKEASGTGMGEGHGKTDISLEIEDENQLLGSSEKDLEGETLEGKESISDKGIEMGEDFEGDLMDISGTESDGSQENDSDGVPIESKMGECDDNGNTVDESLLGKDDKENAGQKGLDKYETGSSLQQMDSDLEFRARDTNNDGPEDPHNEQGTEEQLQKDSKVDDGFDEVHDDFDSILEEKDAYEKPSGIDPSVNDKAEEKKPEEHEVDDMENLTSNSLNDLMDKMDMSSDISDTKEGEGEEQGPSNIDVDGETDADAGELLKENIEDGNSDCKQETCESKALEHPSNQKSDIGGLPQGVTDSSSPLQTPSNLLNASVDISSMESLLFEERAEEPIKGSNMASSKPIAGSSGAAGLPKQSMSSDGKGKEDNFQNLDRLDADPYRSLGDILQQWKERVTMRSESALETLDTQNLNEELDPDASEYQYVSKDKASGGQALGPATFDQMNENKVNKRDFEESILSEETAALVSNKTVHNKEENISFLEEVAHQCNRMNMTKNCEDDDMNKQQAIATLDPEMHKALSNNGEIRTADQSYVSTNFNQIVHANSATIVSNTASCSLEDAHHIRKELEHALSKGSWESDRASSLWAMSEQLTTRLSQELTEQLRLIMEPSLASRLEGDYRTGKRINLKKVIPYIASQFRRDKIWMRRTKPSKRQYQVVLAIDDSRSMSESHCGHVALEALLTICRSMSTLEVGQMAVASFGQKGNVKILHDFDSPFTREAGIQMISQFSFKQDNTIADEPMADLLTYVTCMLDVAAKNISSSGRRQLQQLVLIIADGRFHEKEKLRRCIREAVSRGQMLAFIILDSSQESIMDVQSVSFSGGAPTFSMYIDTFPFPYYIMLKNIDELPQVLADLLRQWFEIVHRARLQ